jgi:superfamily II DNA or RNA helicase
VVEQKGMTKGKAINLANRRFQLEALAALDQLRCRGQRSFLVVAATGSGKTNLGLGYVARMLEEGEAQRVVVVCGGTQQREQWSGAATRFGVRLDHDFSNADGFESSGFNGVAVTYQQVASQPDLYRLQCGEKKTLVVLDECHHAADRRAWGDSVRRAFELAEYRLSLSGTLFREDGRSIPFVDFAGGVCRPDYTYPYARAVEERVCRPVEFCTYDGEVTYLREGNDEVRTCRLSDLVDPATGAERLRVALDPGREWLRRVVADANAALTSMREAGHPDAGGLIVTMDQLHAARVAALVEDVTGEEPALVVSDDPEAANKIKRFARGNQRWLVAVRMVSEGTDIPRLRVGVFATHVRSELFFRQFCGRLLRFVPGLREQSAVVFLPVGEALGRYALGFKEEREYAPAPDDEDESEAGCNGSGFDPGAWGEHLLKSLSATASKQDTIFDGASYPQVELTAAAQVIREMGVSVPYAHAAALIRLGAAQAGVFLVNSQPNGVPTGGRGSKPTVPAGKMLVKRADAMARSLAELAGKTVDEIHREWIAEGGMPPEIATREDLERKLVWMEQLIGDDIDAKGHRFGDDFLTVEELMEGLRGEAV